MNATCRFALVVSLFCIVVIAAAAVSTIELESVEVLLEDDPTFDQDEETVFDAIIRKKVPASILYEDELALAFEDIHPQAPVHFLVIPSEY